MGFDIVKFAEEFKDLINWMLESKYSKEIKSDFRTFQTNKDKLKLNPDSLDALQMIIELIATKGYRLNKPILFDENINSFFTKYGSNFRTPQAKEELAKLVGNHGEKSIKHFLDFPSTIEQFTAYLYQLAKQDKTVVLGRKGRDLYLRNFSYLDRIPIDRHEMRFIVRSGIFHSCSVRSQSDPLDRNDIQTSLSLFCKQYLGGLIVENIDLGSAPGLVDKFIWSFCSEKRHNICKIMPNCLECKLNTACLYTITNT